VRSGSTAVSKPVILHIGMPKTGTSSIQQYLHNNRSALRGRGFVVPTTPGRLNHESIALYALADASRATIRRRHELLSVAAVKRFRESFLTDLASEAAGWRDDETVILTNEHMSQLGEPEEFGRLQELLAILGRRPVRVVIYLRRQDLSCLSGYSQRIKTGGTLHWSELTGEIDRSVFDYEAILERWRSVFGKESLSVRVFERRQWVRGDLIWDFLSAVGCEEGPDLGKSVHKNESLDARSLEYLRRLNPWYPRFVDGRLNPRRQALVAAMQRIAEGPSLRMDRDLAEKFLDRYREGNARIAREYLGRSDGRLFLDMPSDEPAPAPALSIDDAMEISAKLWAVGQDLDPPTKRVRAGRRRAKESSDEGWL
jgi:hypothetical protein